MSIKEKMKNSKPFNIIIGLLLIFFLVFSAVMFAGNFIYRGIYANAMTTIEKEYNK